MDAKDNRSAANPGETLKAWLARAENGSWELALVPEESAWSWAEWNPSVPSTWPGRPEEGIGQALPARRHWLSSRTALFLLVGDDLQRLARTAEGQPVLGEKGGPWRFPYRIRLGWGLQRLKESPVSIGWA